MYYKNKTSPLSQVCLAQCATWRLSWCHNGGYSVW